MRWLAILLGVSALMAAPAAQISRAIRENRFDRGECYRVRDITIVRPGVRIYLTDGYVIFSQPVEGRRIAAVYSSDVEGGDAEVIVMPPDKGERRTLASYIGTPNLDEHIRSAVFLGTSDLYGEITAQMPSNPTNRKAPEMGALLDEKWSGVLRNLTMSYETRLALDLIGGTPPEYGLLAGLFGGTKLSNFDVIFDPRAAEPVTSGQVVNRDNRTFFDVWTAFEPRNYQRSAPLFGSEVALTDYRIEATVTPDLAMQAVTRVKLTPTVDNLRVVALDIARTMVVESASIDGKAAEVLQREALRANLRRSGNEVFLMVPATPLRIGHTYEVEIRHNGNVILDAGDKVYYVTARASWYPANGLQYTTFDLKFKYPKDLDMVGPGDVVEDETVGEWRTTRRRTAAPIRIAGFNLGAYRHARVTRAGYVVEVYANRSLEEALRPKMAEPIFLPPVMKGRNPIESTRVPIVEQPAAAVSTLQTLAGEIADALQFMAGKFGPPSLPFLTVAPIPGTFGQGFPGLIYLSTRSYLRDHPPSSNPAAASRDLFFNEVLQAHETAHQWWGNLVMAASYRDYWLMEALANYSAMLYLEKHKGPRSLDQMLEEARRDLLLKGVSGQELDQAGPIVLGTRLESSLEPRAWRAITYGKGAWILHMLRRRLGDERFFAMLGELRKQYEHKEVSTEAFRALAARYLPPKSDDPKLEAFFDEWVYSTGIPALKLQYSMKGKLPALRVVGTITQSEVGDDFTMMVPVEIQVARGKTITQWVRTSNEPVEFSVPLRAAPLKVVLDPHGAVLRR